MSIVIIYGPPASGKTTNAERLKNHYRCERVVDGWSEGDRIPLRDGDLVLTNSPPPFSILGAVAVDIETAKIAIGGRLARRTSKRRH